MMVSPSGSLAAQVMVQLSSGARLVALEVRLVISGEVLNIVQPVPMSMVRVSNTATIHLIPLDFHMV